MRSVGAKIAGSFGLALLILGIIGILAFTSLRKMIDANHWVVHTHQVIEKLEDVLKLLDDAETGQRGYVITGEQRYLEPYRQSRLLIDQRLQEIRYLARDNPRQGQRLDRLTPLINSKQSVVQETINLRAGAGGFAAARALILTDRGKNLMDDIRAVVAEMEQEEDNLLFMRDRTAEASARNTQAVIAVGVPLAFILLGLLAVLLTRNIAAPLRKMTAVAEQIAAGDLTVVLPAEYRRDEVGVLAESFSRMTGWLQQMAGVAGQIAEGDLNVTVTPRSERDQLGHAFALMISNLRTLTTDLRRSEEWLRVTLSSIGDAVITTDTAGGVTFLNPVAEALTGWTRQDAVGQPVRQVFTIINEQTREQADDIVGRVLREGMIVALANHTALVSRDGHEIAIEDSAAPIADSAGNMIGVVLVFHDVTARRRAQEALLEQAALLNLAHDAIIVRGTGDRVTFWSQGAVETYGWTREEAMGRITYELLQTRFPTPLDEISAEMVEQGRWEGELIHTRKDGREIVVASRWAVQRNEAGHQVGVLEINRNITEVKRSEAERERLLAEVQRRAAELTATFASVADGLASYDLEARVLTMNATAEHLLGYTSKERARPLEERLQLLALTRADGTRRPYEANPTYRAIHGETVRGEVNVIHRQDHTIWLSISAAPILLPDGAQVGSVATFTDITPLHEAQQELRRLADTLEQQVQERTAQLTQALAHTETARAEAESAQSRFQGLLASAPDGVLIVDAGGSITFVNKQLEALSDYTHEELIGHPVEVLIPARFEEIHLRHRAEYMAAPRTRPMGVGLELFLRRKDGSEMPVEISLSPFQTPGGVLVIASIRDITERKRAEAEILRLNTELLHNVEQLTAANKELEAFSYSVSHDLRAPLRGIDGFSKILLDKYAAQIDAAGQDYLTRVRKAAVRMSRLIDDMLNLSRIGRREMRREPLNLSELADAVVTDLRQRDPERQVQVEIQPDLEVAGDAGLLRIVLENLLGNAWKFTGKAAEAHIAVGAMTQGAERVYFVRDNGAGFDMSYADKLFTPFQRLHTEEDFPGTGIGLAIVQRIIARHGGRVWAEGEEGKGATIYFTLGEEER